MNTTEKGHKLSVDTLKNMAIVFLGAIIISFVAFTAIEKPNYSPIVLTDVSSHVLGTSYQATVLARWNVILYSVNITSVISLTGGQSGSITLQTSPDNATWTNISTTTNNTTGTLTVGLNISNAQTTTLSAAIPPAYYYRLVSSGTSSFSIINGREMAF